MPQPEKITSWSYSRFNLWDECAFKANQKFIKKIAEPGSPQMDRGNIVHKALENYLKGYASKLVLDKQCQPKAFGTLFKKIRDKRKADPASVFVEDTFAFRSDWSETTWNDWDGCWLRVKIDCATVDGDVDDVKVHVRDWKTGRFRENDSAKYALQLDLYALGSLIKYQTAKSVTVTPSLVYLDEGIEYSPRAYDLSDLPRLKKEWSARVKPMLADTKFVPKPNNWCGRCFYRKDNGGACKF